MFNVCHHCGLYRADKIIDSSGPYAICPECGYRHAFKQLPLLIVSGASGAGKSSVCQALLGRLDPVILLDSDILWRPEFNNPERHHDFFETWLRMAKNISQSGRPVVLIGAGQGVPANIEPCVERRYFSQIHYLALVCNDGTLLQRLKMRPAWRGSDPSFVEEQIQFNRWFKGRENGNPPIALIDTTEIPLDASAEQVWRWIDERIHSGPGSG